VFARFGLLTTSAAAIALACLGVLSWGASGALANSAALTVTNTAGQIDPVAGVPRVFTVAGNTLSPEGVYVKYRAIGGEPCAPSAVSDTGAWLFDTNRGEANGDFQFQRVLTWEGAGPEMFCTWIASSSDAIASPITNTITFRAPTGTVNASVNPGAPTPGQQFTVTVAGASESPTYVFAKIRAAGGAPCAPTYEADGGSGVIDDASVNGAFSISGTSSEAQPGTYTLCAWLAQSESAAPAIAGPQAIDFTVAAPLPPPPCVVPAFSAHTRLASVEARIRAGHCRVGRIRYAHSRHVRRGAVVSLSPRPHARLGWGAYVSIVLSVGR